MLSRYNKSIELWRDNDVDNALTEVSLAENSAMVKERAEHQPVVLSTKYHLYADKPVPVVIIPRERFIGGPTRQGRTGSIQGYW